jgi:integrase
METRKRQDGIKKLSNGMYEAGVWIPEHGKYLRKQFPTKTLAKAWRNKKRADILNEEAGVTKRRKVPFTEAAQRFLSNSETELRPATAKFDKWCVERWRDYAPFSSKTLGQITREDVRKFKQKLIRDAAESTQKVPGKVDGLRCADYQLSRLKRLFYMFMPGGDLVDAEKEEVLKSNPAARLKRLKADDHRVRFLTQDEEARILAAAEPYMRRYFLFGTHMGLRRNEQLTLRWKDVDLTKGRETVKVRSEKSKNGKPRHVPLDATALSVLRELPNPARPDALVFGNGKGKLNKCLNRTWGILMKKAKVEDFHIHDMRHDFASKLVMKGVGLQQVMVLLGHSDYRTVLRYAHLSPSGARDAVMLLDQHLQNTYNTPEKGGGEVLPFHPMPEEKTLGNQEEVRRVGGAGFEPAASCV